MRYSKVPIAIDFDGTCVDHRYPDVGPDVPGAVDTLKRLVAEGALLILWTARPHGPRLDEAVAWFKGHGIPLYGIQRNPEQDHWTNSPKAYAHIYIDDAAFGCPMLELAKFKRKCVDWDKVREALLGPGLMLREDGLQAIPAVPAKVPRKRKPREVNVKITPAMVTKGRRPVKLKVAMTKDEP